MGSPIYRKVLFPGPHCLESHTDVPAPASWSSAREASSGPLAPGPSGPFCSSALCPVLGQPRGGPSAVGDTLFQICCQVRARLWKEKDTVSLMSPASPFPEPEHTGSHLLQWGKRKVESLYVGQVPQCNPATLITGVEKAGFVIGKTVSMAPHRTLHTNMGNACTVF